MPWAIGKMPRGTTQQKANELLSSLEDMVADAVGVIPDDSSVELLTVQGKNGEGLYKTMIEMLGEEISIAVCGQNLTSQVKGGSFAAAKTHLDVLAVIGDDDKKLVESSLNKLIRIICDVNALTDIPTIYLMADDEIDNTLSERDERLSKMGVKFTKEYFVKQYGFADDEIDIEQPTVASGAPSSPTSFSESTTKDPLESAQNSIDTGVESIDTAKSNTAMNGLLKPVLDIIKNSATHEEALDKLASSYADMDDDALISILERGIFASEAIGRLYA